MFKTPISHHRGKDGLKIRSNVKERWEGRYWRKAPTQNELCSWKNDKTQEYLSDRLWWVKTGVQEGQTWLMESSDPAYFPWKCHNCRKGFIEHQSRHRCTCRSSHRASEMRPPHWTAEAITTAWSRSQPCSERADLRRSVKGVRTEVKRRREDICY